MLQRPVVLSNNQICHNLFLYNDLRQCQQSTFFVLVSHNFSKNTGISGVCEKQWQFHKNLEAILKLNA